MFHFALTHRPSIMRGLPAANYCGPYCRLASHPDNHLLASGTACAVMLAVLCGCERQKRVDPSLDALYSLPYNDGGGSGNFCLDDAPSPVDCQ